MAPELDAPDTAIRRFLLWWFRWPAAPHVVLNLSVDVTPALSYLDQVNAHRLPDQPRVSLQHLLAGVIAQTLRVFPEANLRILGSWPLGRRGPGEQLLRAESVGIAMPVNLLGHEAGGRRELGLCLLEQAERKSLVQIATETSGLVREERAGRSQNAITRWMLKAGENLPPRLMEPGLDLFERLARHPALARALFPHMPVTTGLTNPGSTFRVREGVLFRGGAIQLPDRLVHLGTLWGVSTVQDEVIPVDGVPVVRPMLPVLLLFDHRLIDGVRASRLALYFADLLRDPGPTFGPSGAQAPPQPPPR